MSEWFETPEGTERRVWQTLGRGLADRRAPARHPVLATRGVEAGAEARVVVLRGVDAEARLLKVHTDVRSGKITELRADPACALLIWDAKANLQIRLRALAEVIVGDAAIWARIPPGAQRVYGGSPTPGARLGDPQNHEPDAILEAFARIVLEVQEIETLHLGPDLHRRARFERSSDWTGTWLAP